MRLGVPSCTAIMAVGLSVGRSEGVGLEEFDIEEMLIVGSLVDTKDSGGLEAFEAGDAVIVWLITGIDRLSGWLRMADLSERANDKENRPDTEDDGTDVPVE